MKFRVQMKDPDVLHDAVDEAVLREVEATPLNDVEKALVAEDRRESVLRLCGRWFAHHEYLTVEIDTDAGTCTVVQR